MGAATLDASGWEAFMETSKHSARSEHDAKRQTDLDDAVVEDRLNDIAVRDFFADKVAESQGSPS